MQNQRTDVNAHALAAGIVYRSESEAEARAVAPRWHGSTVVQDRIGVWAVMVEPDDVAAQVATEDDLALHGELERFAELDRLTALTDAANSSDADLDYENPVVLELLSTALARLDALRMELYAGCEWWVDNDGLHVRPLDTTA